MSESMDQVPGAADYAYVDTTEGLKALLEQAGGAECERCAIDTEADSLHCYEEKLCLIQFSAAGHFAVIDPFACDDLEPLVEFQASGLSPGLSSWFGLGSRGLSQASC